MRRHVQRNTGFHSFNRPRCQMRYLCVCANVILCDIPILSVIVLFVCFYTVMSLQAYSECNAFAEKRRNTQ